MSYILHHSLTTHSERPGPPLAFVLQFHRFLGESLRHLTQLLLQCLVGNLMLPDLYLQLLKLCFGLPLSAVAGMVLLFKLQAQVLDGALELHIDFSEVFHFLLVLLVDVLQACQLILGTATNHGIIIHDQVMLMTSHQMIRWFNGTFFGKKRQEKRSSSVVFWHSAQSRQTLSAAHSFPLTTD